MKTLKIVRLLLIVISLSLAGFGFTLLAENPDPAHCVCDNPECGTITCNYGYVNGCRYKDIGGLWIIFDGPSNCPITPL